MEITLLNVPKWLLDKRGVNGPVLPIPKPQIYSSASFGVLVVSAFDPAVDVDGGVAGLTYTTQASPLLTSPWTLWPGVKAFAIVNEAAGTNDLRFSMTGPGVVSFIGFAGQTASTTGVYRCEFDIQLDGVSLTGVGGGGDPIVISPYYGSGINYRVVSTPLGSIMGVPEPVPLYFKDSLEIYGQVVYRSASSTNNVVGGIVKAYQAL